MPLHLRETSQKLTADVGPVADISFNSKRYITSNEDGTATAFVWNDDAIATAGDTVLTIGGDTVLRFAAPIEVATDVSATLTSFTVSGIQDAIDTMTVNGNVLDFTTGSLAGAEGSTGITLSLEGLSEQQAFNPVFYPFIVNSSRNLPHVGRDDLFRESIRVGTVDSYTVTVGNSWVTPEEITSATVTSETAGATIVNTEYQGNVICFYVSATAPGRKKIKVSYTTDSRSDFMNARLDAIS